MAQGRVPAGMHALMPGGRAGGERQEAGMDVSINDAPPDTRHFLTRRPTQARPAAQPSLCPSLVSGWLPALHLSALAMAHSYCELCGRAGACQQTLGAPHLCLPCI